MKMKGIPVWSAPRPWESDTQLNLANHTQEEKTSGGLQSDLMNQLPSPLDDYRVAGLDCENDQA